MSDYDDSFNMVFGTHNTQIDLFDNPYVKINVYDDQTSAIKLSDRIKLIKCSHDYLSSWMTE